MTQVVYLIEQYGRCYTKIGIAKNPEQRRIEVQCGNPIPLTLRYTIEHSDISAEVLEKRFHARFARSRAVGEWFKLSAKDVVDALIKDGDEGLYIQHAYDDERLMALVAPEPEPNPPFKPIRLFPAIAVWFYVAFWFVMTCQIFNGMYSPDLRLTLTQAISSGALYIGFVASGFVFWYLEGAFEAEYVRWDYDAKEIKRAWQERANGHNHNGHGAGEGEG